MDRIIAETAFLAYPSSDGPHQMVQGASILAVLQDFQEEIVGQIQEMIYQLSINYSVLLLVQMERTMTSLLKAVFHVASLIVQFAEIQHFVWTVSPNI